MGFSVRFFIYFMFIDLNDVKSNIDMTLLFELIQILISDSESNIDKYLSSKLLMISHIIDNCPTCNKKYQVGEKYVVVY